MPNGSGIIFMIHNAYTTKLKGGFTTIGIRVALTTMLTVDLGADLSLYKNNIIFGGCLGFFIYCLFFLFLISFFLYFSSFERMHENMAMNLKMKSN